MTLSSAYIELFIREKVPGGNVRGKCPDTVIHLLINLQFFLLRDKTHHIFLSSSNKTTCTSCGYLPCMQVRMHNVATPFVVRPLLSAFHNNPQTSNSVSFILVFLFHFLPSMFSSITVLSSLSPLITCSIHFFFSFLLFVSEFFLQSLRSLSHLLCALSNRSSQYFPMSTFRRPQFFLYPLFLWSMPLIHTLPDSVSVSL